MQSDKVKDISEAVLVETVSSLCQGENSGALFFTHFSSPHKSRLQYAGKHISGIVFKTVCVKRIPIRQDKNLKQVFYAKPRGFDNPKPKQIISTVLLLGSLF